MNPSIRNNYLYRRLAFLRGLRAWKRRNYAEPSPTEIKKACLLRNGIPDATWVETGTYQGSTTYYLAKHAKKVISIEPEPTLYASAKKFFSRFPNVEIINGPSEKIFPDLLPRLSGNINFWLDGHYSAGVTYKGEKETPILDELRIISGNLSHFDRACILVDDIRMFSNGATGQIGYPSLDVLVDWARQNELEWHIEQDIFCAYK